MGKYLRKDLVAAQDLKTIFQNIRNYLAANAVGITQDVVFAQQIIHLLFCKIYDERFTKPNETVLFRAAMNESDDDIHKRILQIFSSVKNQYPDLIDASLDLDSIRLYVCRMMKNVTKET